MEIQMATKIEIGQEMGKIIQTKVTIMGIMVDNQGNQITIAIEITQLEVPEGIVAP